MTQPVNPNSDLPMSLRIDRIQHLRQIQSDLQQGQAARQADQEAELKQQRVEKNDETAKGRIRDEKRESGSRKKKKRKKREKGEQNTSDSKNDNDDNDKGKGQLIDIKV